MSEPTVLGFGAKNTVSEVLELCAHQQVPRQTVANTGRVSQSIDVKRKPVPKLTDLLDRVLFGNRFVLVANTKVRLFFDKLTIGNAAVINCNVMSSHEWV